MKIMSLITHPHVRSSLEHKLIYFCWNPRAFWPSIDSNTTDTFKTQMWHQWFILNFMKLWEYFLCVKKIFSAVSVCDARSRENHNGYESLPLLRNKSQHIWVLHLSTGSCISSIASMLCGTLVNVWRRLTWKRRNCWIEVVIFVFFAHKKYSHSFIELRLNHWCHMDYFNDVLTFWALNMSVAVEAQKALGFHHKYLNLYSEDESKVLRVRNNMRVSN